MFNKDKIVEKMNFYILKYQELLCEKNELEETMVKLEKENKEMSELLESANRIIEDSQITFEETLILTENLRNDMDKYEDEVNRILNRLSKKVEMLINDEVDREKVLDELKLQIDNTKKDIEKLNQEMK